MKFILRVLFANERLVACGHGILHWAAEVSTVLVRCGVPTTSPLDDPSRDLFVGLARMPRARWGARFRFYSWGSLLNRTVPRRRVAKVCVRASPPSRGWRPDLGEDRAPTPAREGRHTHTLSRRGNAGVIRSGTPYLQVEPARPPARRASDRGQLVRCATPQHRPAA